MNLKNLDTYPPRNWSAFVAECHAHEIREIVFTGTTTDPHLYKHEARLIHRVREDLPGAKISIHTNGALSLKKIDTFNLYDRACISFPSFNTTTYAAMMGVPQVPDLGRLLERAEIPVKVSCIINEHNAHEVEPFLLRLSELGVQRVVLRRLYGDTRTWDILPGLTPVRYYRENPVYEIYGMEVTWWNFETTTSRSINLFADGTLSTEYLLTEVTKREFA